MSAPILPDPDTWAEVVDPVCDAFEQAWQKETPPRIEDYLGEVEEPLRSRLWTELLLSELECRRRRGDVPTPEEYWHRFPDRREQVAHLFSNSADLRTINIEYPPAATTVGPGRVVGGYEVIEEIGRGGMGVVYKARQPSLKRIVALKMILSGAHAGVEERTRFRREAEAAARLNHPHIVQIHEVGAEGDLPFLAMEFVDGPSLDRLLARHHAQGSVGLTPTEAARLVETLARAIHYAHQCGVVHRDLKPANVLLSSEFESNSVLSTQYSVLVPKVTDFGLAKFLEGAGEHTHTGAVLGTPSYMAPEQAGAGGAIGPAADVHALGVILYELLTGRLPFQGASLAETMEQVRTAEPLPPARLQPRLPRDLQTICLKCLHKEPGRRYASAEALAQDLARFLAGEPIHARPVSIVERAVKWAWRRPLVAGSLAAVVLTVAGAFGVVAWQLRVTDQARIDAEAKGAETLIALAQSQWLLDNLTDARRLLDDCPQQFRTPEWQRLHWVCHAEIASFKDQDIRGDVVFAPDQTTLLWSTRRAVMMWPGAGGPKICCEPPGDLLAAPAVDREGGRLTFLAAGRELLVAPFGKPEERLIQRIVSVWDWETITKVKEWKFDQPYPPPNKGFTLSPDGRYVITGDKDSWRILEGHSGKSLRAFPGPTPYNLTFSPRGQLMAFCTKKDGDITIWDLAADREVQRIPAAALVERYAFSHDERQLAHLTPLPRSNPWIKVWDLEQRAEKAAWFCREADDLTFSPDSRFLAYSVEKRLIRLRDLVADRDAVTFRGHASQITGLTFSPDGRRLASVAQDFTIKVWDLGPLAD